MSGTLFTSAPQSGRFYGEQGESVRRIFYAEQAPAGNALLCERGVGKGSDVFTLKAPATLLIELDLDPGVPYLAQAVLIEGNAEVRYTPVELQSLDNSVLPEPGLAARQAA
jgi:hypothetical protein